MSAAVFFALYVVSRFSTLRYKRIVEVIDAAKGAGLERVGIVTEGMRRPRTVPE
jgi:biopolymer transport protein ExbD